MGTIECPRRSDGWRRRAQASASARGDQRSTKEGVRRLRASGWLRARNERVIQQANPLLTTGCKYYLQKEIELDIRTSSRIIILSRLTIRR
jgi:hypothetical protein